MPLLNVLSLSQPSLSIPSTSSNKLQNLNKANNALRIVPKSSSVPEYLVLREEKIGASLKGICYPEVSSCITISVVTNKVMAGIHLTILTDKNLFQSTLKELRELSGNINGDIFVCSAFKAYKKYVKDERLNSRKKLKKIIKNIFPKSNINFQDTSDIQSSNIFVSNKKIFYEDAKNNPILGNKYPEELKDLPEFTPSQNVNGVKSMINTPVFLINGSLNDLSEHGETSFEVSLDEVHIDANLSDLKTGFDESKLEELESKLITTKNGIELLETLQEISKNVSNERYMEILSKDAIIRSFIFFADCRGLITPLKSALNSTFFNLKKIYAI